VVQHPAAGSRRYKGGGYDAQSSHGLYNKATSALHDRKHGSSEGIEEEPTNRIGRNMNPIAFVMLCLFLIVNPALAQPSATSPAAPLPLGSVFDKLPGRWVRLQGGYVITIKAVDADGTLDASYANPRPLPFYVAVASRDGNAIKLLFELRAGGYNGSTYTLSYDANNDRLTGVYDQVVVQQKFDVVFVRDKS
jgi:hypothetical protein